MPGRWSLPRDDRGVTFPAGRWTRRGVLAAGAAGLASACSSGSGSPPAPTPGTPASPGSATAAGHTSRSGVDWSRLTRHVEGTLARPGDPTYDMVRLVENPRYDAAHPLAVLSAAAAPDVATALAFAQDHDLPVALRSGGHSYPGWSAGDGGGVPRSLVIDLRPMSGVSLSSAALPTGQVATIGAGAALAPVYDSLGRRGRAIAGGSCATVGIAGLTLGGGAGVLTRAMGLTCDAVTSMQVVTADGSVRTASAQEEPDLFWALRGGGGGHLGIVTSFDFETSTPPTLQTVYLQWPISAAAQVIEAWQDWAPDADPELWSTLKALGGQQHADGPILLLSGTWTGAAGAFDRQLAGLLDHVPTPSTNTRASRSYRDAMLSYAGCASIPVDQCNTGPGGSLTRQSFGATSHVAYQPLTPAGVDDLLAQVHAAQSSGL